MSALMTGCGIYCAICAAVGLYFFLVLAAMEFNQNQALKYVWNIDKGTIPKQKEDGSYATDQDLIDNGDAIDMAVKGNAFLILALVQAIFLVACSLCASISIKSDAEAEENELKIKREQQYESVGQNENMDQIMS